MILKDLTEDGWSVYFDRIRDGVYHGHLTQDQVDGHKAIHAACRDAGATLHQCAYILATADWETAHTMKPIREYGRGRGHRYGRADPTTGHAYFGRGFVQLTWKSNYQHAGECLGIDLVHDPDRCLEPATAAAILVRGMLEGWYGPPLTRYVIRDDEDFEAARHVVNAHDYRSYTPIAEVAREIVDALKAAQGET